MLARMWRKGNPQFTLGGNADWCSHCGTQYRISSKKLKIEPLFNPVTPLLGIHAKNPKTPVQKNLCTPMVIAALSTRSGTAYVPISRGMD